jgi:cell division protein FtsL
MMLRLLHLVVIAALIVAAAYVYKIKFDSTVQAERLAKVRREIRQERDAIALLRAEWAKLDNPARIEDLAKRHLKLRSVEATQFSDFAKLPPRPPQIVPPDAQDAIAALIENIEDSDLPTGSTEPATESNPETTAAPEGKN